MGTISTFRRRLERSALCGRTLSIVAASCAAFSARRRSCLSSHVSFVVDVAFVDIAIVFVCSRLAHIGLRKQEIRRIESGALKTARRAEPSRRRAHSERSPQDGARMRMRTPVPTAMENNFI
jgi:hypothetical protein